MDISLTIIIIFAIAFDFWLVWFFYQIYLAAWNKKGAKKEWITLMNKPYGQLFFPFLKWSSVILLIAGLITITQMIIYLMFRLIYESAQPNKNLNPTLIFPRFSGHLILTKRQYMPKYTQPKA